MPILPDGCHNPTTEAKALDSLWSFVLASQSSTYLLVVVVVVVIIKFYTYISFALTMFRLFTLATLAVTAWAVDTTPNYGVDCTFPIQHYEMTCPDMDRREFYEDFMQGCRDSLGPRKGKACDTTEEDRIHMSLYQPQSMVVSTK